MAIDWMPCSESISKMQFISALFLFAVRIRPSFPSAQNGDRHQASEQVFESPELFGRLRLRLRAYGSITALQL